MKIKVCGLRDPTNIEAIASLNPDFMGFIFYEPSARFVNDLHEETLKSIPASIVKTAVFVNENAETINMLIDKYGFTAIQLHGNESPEFCGSFREKVTVIKAFGLDSRFNFYRLKEYKGKVDFFLFDTRTDSHGGSGKTFDWSLLNDYQLDIPFLLSGGISMDNLEEVKRISHPLFYGVDLNSKFEIAPGLKNIAQVEEAFDSIKPSTNR